jgi:hypothetical protein
MRLLYVVFVLSMAALVWTAISVRRYIRNHDAHPADPLKLPGSKADEAHKQHE